jgi:hypothetical protein
MNLISIIEGNPQTLPQIRIDDVETESCLNVTAITCPNNLRLIIICRLGTCVRSISCSGANARSTSRCEIGINHDHDHDHDHRHVACIIGLLTLRHILTYFSIRIFVSFLNPQRGRRGQERSVVNARGEWGGGARHWR